MPRHVSTHFAELNFALSKNNGNYVALCLVCGRYLKNTAAKRILAHRNICKENNATLMASELNSDSPDCSDIAASAVTSHSIFEPGEIKRSKGNVWNFFNYDKETKQVTCKYCNKQYKRNATRMQEHLNVCAPFQASDERTDFEIRHRNKQPENVQIIDFDTEDSLTETVNFDSDLIRVEHKYNSVSPSIRSGVPSKRRIPDEGLRTYSAYDNQRLNLRDEFAIFGEHVANELRKIKRNAVLLANTKLTLNEVLHKAVIESLKVENCVSTEQLS